MNNVLHVRIDRIGSIASKNMLYDWIVGQQDLIFVFFQAIIQSIGKSVQDE
jgi:hypothetical protein